MKYHLSRCGNATRVLVAALLALLLGAGPVTAGDLLAFTTPEKKSRHFQQDIAWCTQLANHLEQQDNFAIPPKGEAMVHHLDTDRFFDNGNPVVDMQGRPVPNSPSVESGSSRRTMIYAICLR
ncbi:MAG: hypothetical protein JSW10_08420, partial [Pseudomonadota bacterium]